jgi:hypothetical protein
MKHVYAVLKTELLDPKHKETMFTDVIAVFTSLKELNKHKFVDSDNVYYEVKKMPINEVIQDDFIKGIESLLAEGQMGIMIKNGKIMFMPFKKG